jgi:hypothetical protein
MASLYIDIQGQAVSETEVEGIMSLQNKDNCLPVNMA